MKKRKGMAAILTVIIISAAVLLMAYSASILGLGDLEFSVAADKSNEAIILTDGCVEEVFRRIILDNNYTATNENLTVGGNYCIINVNGSVSSKNIVVSGFIDDYSNKVEVQISISSNNVIQVNSWKESST